MKIFKFFNAMGEYDKNLDLYFGDEGKINMFESFTKPLIGLFVICFGIAMAMAAIILLS